MKVLVVTMLYEPDCVGIAAIASDMCRGLAERGHDVTVYTAYPYYPEWRLKTKVNRWQIQKESLNGVAIRRHGLFIPSSPSRLMARLLHEMSFFFSLMRSLRIREDFDAVMVFCPLLGSVAFAAIRKLLHREPIWVNIQDIPADACLGSGISHSKTLHLLSARLQGYLFDCGDLWSSVSPGMVSRLEKMQKRRHKVHYCPNWLTHSLMKQVRQLPSKVGTACRNPIRLFYSGTIGKKQGLLEFCKRLKEFGFDYRFKIRGSGGEVRELRSWVEAVGDPRFEFAGLLPEDEFVRSIHESDWFVISERSSAGCSFLPSKLIPSVSIGTPVLAVSDRAGPLGQEVSRANIGIVVEWAQLDTLPSKLESYRRRPEDFTTLQSNCRRNAGVHEREQAISRIESLMQEMVQRASQI